MKNPFNSPGAGVGKVGPEVIEHWFTLIPWQQFFSEEFYSEIEQEIRAQKIPALTVDRVEISEGGWLSDNRTYLRMTRERLTFDVCAAPVGVNYFFSYRFYVQKVVVGFWHFALMALALFVLFLVCGRFLGILGIPFYLFILAAAAWTMRNAVGLGLRDLDTTLLKIPVLNLFYERFFRKDSYYRQDVRLAYCAIVASLVKGKVETMTAAKGVQLLREFKYSPVLDGLYGARNTDPSAVGEK